MAKPHTQRKAAFYFISFLGTTPGDGCPILPRQVDRTLPSQETLQASWAHHLKASTSKTGIPPKTTGRLGIAWVARKALPSAPLLLPLRSA